MQTSYQLPPQRQVLLPPASETCPFLSRIVLDRRVPQSQRLQDQTLLPLLAELQLTQSDQARLQTLLGPTALHSHWEGKRTVHAPRSTRPKTPACLTQQLFQLFAQNRKIAPVWRREAKRSCAASFCQRRCCPCGAAWSHGPSMRIFGFPAVKRSQEAPPSASHRTRVVSQKSPSQPSLDVRGGWCSASIPP